MFHSPAQSGYQLDAGVIACVRALLDVQNAAVHQAANHALNTSLNVSNDSFTFFLTNFARILACTDPSIELMTRQYSAYLLKSYLVTPPPLQSDSRSSCVLSDAGQHEVKAHLLSGICDAGADLRAAASTTISAACGLSEALPLKHWLELLPTLVALVEGPGATQFSQAGAFLTLVKLAQDAPAKLDQERLGRPLNHLVPLFLKYATSSTVEIRVMSMEALSSVVSDSDVGVPTAIRANLEGLLDVLGHLGSDPEPKVRRLVVESLYNLLEALGNKLAESNRLPSICEFMVASISDPDAEVAKAALDFICLFTEVKNGFDGELETGCGIPPEVQLSIFKSQNLVPRLVPLLVSSTVYNEEERGDLLEENRRADQLAKQGGGVRGGGGNVAPTFFRSRASEGGGVGGGGDDDDDDDDDQQSAEEDYEWTKRRAALAALDALAVFCGTDPEGMSQTFQSAFLPLMQGGLSSPDDWHKEAAIHCFGVCGIEGMGHQLEGNLTTLYPYLMGVLTQPCLPQLKKTACWTLGRYSSWVGRQAPANASAPPPLFNHIAVLFGVSQTFHPKVQEQAIIAFNRVVERHSDKLQPILTPIYQNLAICLAAFDGGPLEKVYEALQILAQEVGPQIGAANLPSLFVPTLMSKWAGIHTECVSLMHARQSGGSAAQCQSYEDALRNKTYRLLPLLDAIATNCVALKSNFQPWAVEAFDRAIDTITHNLLYISTTRTRLDVDDAAPIVCSFDIIDGLVEGFEGNFCGLLEASKNGAQLLQLLGTCLNDKDYPNVVVTALAVVGDIAKLCPSVAVPVYDELIAMCVKIIPEGNVSRSLRVTSNSLWACGHLCVHVTPDMIEPHRLQLLRGLVGRLEKTYLSEENEALLENLSFCLGAVAKADGRGLRVHEALQDKIDIWMEGIMRMCDPKEKIVAMQGACLAIKYFPDLVMAGVSPRHGSSHRKNSVKWFIMAALSFHVERDHNGSYPSVTGLDRSWCDKENISFDATFSQDESEYSHDLKMFGDNVAALLVEIRTAIPGGVGEWRQILHDLPAYLKEPFRLAYGASTGL